MGLEAAQHGEEFVDFLDSVVEVEGGAAGVVEPESLVEWHGAVVTDADGDSGGIETFSELIGVESGVGKGCDSGAGIEGRPVDFEFREVCCALQQMLE